jgi:hypothetical protein
MRWITRAALKRLMVAAVVSSLLVFGLWWIMMWMPLRSSRGPLPPLEETAKARRDELRRTVVTLAGDIGERNVARPARLSAAADFIESGLTNAGLPVSRQVFEARGVSCANLEAEIRGNTRPEEIVMVGAHYDSAPGTPGANDNASAVASKPASNEGPLRGAARAQLSRLPSTR